MVASITPVNVLIRVLFRTCPPANSCIRLHGVSWVKLLICN
jgi:hypothetical protein